MSPLESLHYAIGELAYAVARADGKLQKEENDKFAEIVKKELQEQHYEFEVADITYKVMTRDKSDMETTYYWALHEMRIYSHYLSPALKQKFIQILETIAEAFPPATFEEKGLVERFKMDIEPLKGDPVFYNLNR